MKANAFRDIVLHNTVYVVTGGHSVWAVFDDKESAQWLADSMNKDEGTNVYTVKEQVDVA